MAGPVGTHGLPDESLNAATALGLGPSPSAGSLVNTTIRSIESVTVSIPLGVPTRMSTRTLPAREFVIVWVVADNSARGMGYTYAGTGGGAATAQYIDTVIAPLLIGTPAFGPGRSWEPIYQETLLLGRRGLAIRGLSAVDIALWDLFGVTLGAPLYLLLGGERDAVRAYASGGYYQPGDPLALIEAELGRHIDRGFSDFKIKVGGAAFGIDVDRVRVAREVIGSDRRLALDANNAWRSVTEALRFIRAVEKYDPWWIEEPLGPDDIPGHAAIAHQTHVPVATGEIHATRWDFRDLIAAGACGIAQPDAGVLGGVSEWMKVAHAAETVNLPIAPHWHANLHAHLAGSVSNCLAVEYFPLDEGIYNFERLVSEPLAPRNGLIPIPQRPGHGIVLDPAAVARFRVGN